MLSSLDDMDATHLSTSSLPTILANRLYLNLKSLKIDPDATQGHEGKKAPLSHIEFGRGRGLGNIGGPLRTTLDDEYIDLGLQLEATPEADAASLAAVQTSDVESRTVEIRNDIEDKYGNPEVSFLVYTKQERKQDALTMRQSVTE